jgi:hypothetical protein
VCQHQKNVREPLLLVSTGPQGLQLGAGAPSWQLGATLTAGDKVLIKAGALTLQ